MITLKTPREIEQMRKSGAVVARILDEMAKMVEPGITTGEIDRYAESRCRDFGVIPVFKGYNGFPACVCISINDEVVHGIPSPRRALKRGDIVGLDFGVSLDGWYGDSARTVPVGPVEPEVRQLLEVTRESLMKGIEQCVPGNKVFDIGHAIESHVKPFGYGIVREFVGHGIGRALHEDPQVPNYGPRGRGTSLKAGMVLAIEPMVNAGRPEVKVLSDGWTAVTMDRSFSAHFEHTVAVTDKGPDLLTIFN